eukprot:TRINITY_DN5637_c0_g1_i1.p1 TRINITY_DN5637_c0_g1~~TRINITY_DN5637_c0_g1_i1.p1  ORF type:complete len:414 (-),score=183.04 TRINITY_DN5637_c0_g1_i1:269-1510(-)
MHPPPRASKRRHVPSSPPSGLGGSLEDPSDGCFYPGWVPPPTGPAELENQFILRLPREPADALREAIRSGTSSSSIKERLAVQLEPDKRSSNVSFLRRGLVDFDGWSMRAKLMDLPTFTGSYKTMDRKNFYKTADICQILICKEGPLSENEEEEPEPAPQPKGGKKVDPLKAADKAYRFPHGLTNPMKNCRKRRFRKTLKKKFVEAPEVEKEVKRLFRVDNDAVSVKWELVTEEELSSGKGKKDSKAAASSSATAGASTSSTVALDEEEESSKAPALEAHDIFGALSDSDDERPNADIDIDSEGDSFDQSDSKAAASGSAGGPTEFSKDMFPKSSTEEEEEKKGGGGGAVARKLEALRIEINQLKQQKIDLENNIAHCDNAVLLQRFQESLNEVLKDIEMKAADEESMSMMFS